MVLQVRVTDSDGSNSVILNASQRSLFRRINSSDEGGKFRVPKNDPKADVLNPETGGDTRFWEIWDTETNTRKNYGPITSITEENSEWNVEGRGRSAFLEDYYGSMDTHYAKIDPIFDKLRFEYVSLLPKVTTIIATPVATTSGQEIFGSIDIDEAYYGLSDKTRDNVIDDALHNPPKQSFWSGMSRNDSIIVDLGEEIPLTTISITFPNWSSKLRWHGAGRDYSLALATSSGNTITEFKGKEFGPFDELYNTGVDTLITGSPFFVLGSTYSGYYDPVVYGTMFYVGQDVPGPIDARYIRVHIPKVHMWAGSWHDDVAAIDAWNYHCNPDYVVGDDPGYTRTPGILTDPLNQRELKPESDCHASILDISAGREILKPDVIRPLALQRIDNNNLQIRYDHYADASETMTTSGGYRHFEPGGFFRRFHVTWSGANTTYYKFYSKDCANCYPDGFNFGIIDHNNTLVYSSDNSSGTDVAVKGHMFTKHINMKGASDAVITYCDSWPALRDPLSYGGSYSYTRVTNDVATIHFRGQSFKWYATIPQKETAASVKIEIRHKTTGTWSAYTTLENSYQLPNNIGAFPVYEISYESGVLLENTIYEIKITNLGGYCSIDSIEGYWSASMSEYNEDSPRIGVLKKELITQIFDGRFSHGTMYKWNKADTVGLVFEGDRVILVSAKGRHHGKATIALRDLGHAPYTYDAGATDHVFIPGGDPIDGSLEINLNTGKRGEEIPQYILFDSNDYFTNGLPWSSYSINVILLAEDYETYQEYPGGSDNFLHRCRDCKTPTGTPVTTNKYIYFDGAFCHEKIGVSVKFEDQTYLEQLKSLTQAFQTEWMITEQGLRVEPRIGIDSNVVLREGQNTVVNYQIVHDATKMASMLLSSGGDIDGLPLSTLTEDRLNKKRLGRSVTRKQDFRNLQSYEQMIGLSRTELKKRRYSEKRITVSYSGPNLSIMEGDTFVLYTKKLGKLRVRIDSLEESETNSGREWHMEVSKWPALQE